MKRALFVLLFLTSLLPYLQAQKAVDVTYTEDQKGNYHFMANNKAYCTYVLHIDFPTLQNLKSDHALPFEAEVKPGTSQLFILSPIDKSGDTKFNNKIGLRKGCLSPVPNPDFVYLLPIGPTLETQAFRINVNRDSSYTVRLKMKNDDTIYAARRGIVTAIDVSNTENDAGATTTNNWNFVEIVHADCSFAQYGVLKKDGALVKPGQQVEAGTPIGIVGGDKFGRGSDIRFSVVYPGPQGNTQIAPVFWTKGNGKGQLKHGGTYSSEFTKALVQLEQPKTKTAPTKAKAPAAKKH
ncbi:MAG: M23 family metallopeptidase [Bacteroidetes bacterium]|nr:M23 family metallopeptidase [Bacteroidota bacterium]